MYINSNLLQAKTLTKRAIESLLEEDYRANYLAASKAYLDVADEVDDEMVKISLVYMSVSCTRMASHRRKFSTFSSNESMRKNIIRTVDTCDIIANERTVFSMQRKRISDLKKIPKLVVNSQADIESELTTLESKLNKIGLFKYFGHSNPLKKDEETFPFKSSTESFNNNILESTLGESFVILDEVDENQSYDAKMTTTTVAQPFNSSTKECNFSDRSRGRSTITNNINTQSDDIHSPVIPFSPQFWSHIISWAGSVSSNGEDKASPKDLNLEKFSPQLSEGRLLWNESSQFGDAIRTLDRSVISSTANEALLNSTFLKLQQNEVKSHTDGVLRLLQVVKTLSEENNSLVAKNEALQHSQEELEKSVSEITKFKEEYRSKLNGLREFLKQRDLSSSAFSALENLPLRYNTDISSGMSTVDEQDISAMKERQFHLEKLTKKLADQLEVAQKELKKRDIALADCRSYIQKLRAHSKADVSNLIPSSSSSSSRQPYFNSFVPSSSSSSSGSSSSSSSSFSSLPPEMKLHMNMSKSGGTDAGENSADRRNNDVAHHSVSLESGPKISNIRTNKGANSNSFFDLEKKKPPPSSSVASGMMGSLGGLHRNNSLYQEPNTTPPAVISIDPLTIAAMQSRQKNANLLIPRSKHHSTTTMEMLQKRSLLMAKK